MKPSLLHQGRINTESVDSSFKGLLGVFERGFRRFKILGTLVPLLPLYGLGSLILGLALFPGVSLYRWASPQIQNHASALQSFEIGVLLGAGYILFGFSLILIVPALVFILRVYPKDWRGPYYSLQTIRWGVYNGLTYVPRYIFLEYLTPTPFNILFYRLMGMKIGRGVQINTTHISDPCLIELGDHVTIGGSATLIAHYGQGGFLVIAKTKIGKGTTIGLRATIMGDVEIGEKVKILPHSVVLPKTKIPDGETWGGIPARKMTRSELKSKSE